MTLGNISKVKKFESLETRDIARTTFVDVLQQNRSKRHSISYVVASV